MLLTMHYSWIWTNSEWDVANHVSLYLPSLEDPHPLIVAVIGWAQTNTLRQLKAADKLAHYANYEESLHV